MFLTQDAVEKAKMIAELQESNSLLKSQVEDVQTNHADLKETVRKQGILVMEHEEILGSGKIEKLFQRVDVLEVKMAETEEAISAGFQQASDDRMQIREDADKNFAEVRENISNFQKITEGLKTRASALESRMKDLGCVAFGPRGLIWMLLTIISCGVRCRPAGMSAKMACSGSRSVAIDTMMHEATCAEYAPPPTAPSGTMGPYQKLRFWRPSHPL